MGRPAWGLRGVEAIDGLVAGALGRLELSPLAEGRELLFPELGERAGILEAGREGEVGLQSPPAFLALPLACKQRWRETRGQKAGNTINTQGLATQPFRESFSTRNTRNSRGLSYVLCLSGPGRNHPMHIAKKEWKRQEGRPHITHSAGIRGAGWPCMGIGVGVGSVNVLLMWGG